MMNSFDPDNGQIRLATDKCAPLVATVVDPWEHIEPSHKTTQQHADFVRLGQEMAAARDMAEALSKIANYPLRWIEDEELRTEAAFAFLSFARQTARNSLAAFDKES